MVVQGILDGFFNLYGVSHQITFQYLQKIANANGYQLKRPLKSRRVLYKRYLAGGNVDTLQSLISLIFVFLAYIVNTKTIQSYSKSRLKELKNDSINTTTTKNSEENSTDSIDSKKVIQKFLINSRKQDEYKKLYFIEDRPFNPSFRYKEEFTEEDSDLIDQETLREDPVSFNSFRSIQSTSPLPSNPQNSPVLELSELSINDSLSLIDLPQLMEVELQSVPQSILSTIFPIASDESESDNEIELETSTKISNDNILEVAFKSAGQIINQVSEPLSTIQEKTLENVLEQVNRYSGQSIVQRNIKRIEDDIKRLELQKLQRMQIPNKLKNINGGQISSRKKSSKRYKYKYNQYSKRSYSRR
jgi:hypothetical protein